MAENLIIFVNAVWIFRRKMKTKKKVIKKKNNSTSKNLLVSFLLDRTGSMINCLQGTITGFNEYINSLKVDKKNKYLFTLTQFDSDGIDIIHNKVKLDSVIKLDDKNYVPRAMTPLYDAIGKTIKELDKESNVLMVIQTDGEENASKEFTKDKICDLIKAKTKNGWTFVYLGTNQDAWAVGSTLGFLKANTMSYVGDNDGTKKLYSGLGVATVAYANAVNANNTTVKNKFFKNNN